jgi:hypothetical protein
MKKSELFFKFELGMIPSTIFVAFGYDSIYSILDERGISKKEFHSEYLHEEESDEILGLACTYFFSKSGNCCLFFKDFFNTIDDLCILNHEIVHVCQQIFKFYDIPLSDDTSEVMAYMSHFIFNQITNKYKDVKLCIRT